MEKTVYLILFCLIFHVNIHWTSADDIIGCGGFIKSDVQLDLTKAKVQLITSYGSVKYTTEPAPNGYYMIPVYEKGDYQIQLQPKSGWSFEPKGPIKVDLEACERNEDINFVFTGFQLHGKVLSAGTKEGPSNINVVLKANEKVLQTTKTIDGRYKFDKVMAGQYSILASRDNLMFSKPEVQVTVIDDTLEVADSPIIHGYSVSGTISNEGQAVKGVAFVLQSDDIQRVDAKACTAGSPPNYTQKGAICYVLSDESGTFKFQSVPVGKYSVVPFHKGEKTVFDVVPSRLSIEVSHSNLVIQTKFTVSGFGVSGQVKYSMKGKGVASAVVSVDGREVTKTDQNGAYAIDGMKAGAYVVSVLAESVHFDAVRVNMLPSDPMLPFITPSRFDLCGKVLLDSAKMRDLSILVRDDNDGSMQENVVPGSNGLFCLAVRPGTYVVKPIVKGPSANFALTPASLKVTITDSPISSESIKFSQFKAVLSGKVVCLSTCGDVDVMLTSKHDSVSAKHQKVTSTSSSVAFVFQGVIPGEYSVSAVRLSWCWADNSLSIRVDDTDVGDIVLTQKGYEASVRSTHTTRISYVKERSPKSKTPTKPDEGEFAVAKGMNKLCFPSVGTFNLKPLSCHTFDKPSYTFNTGATKEPIDMKVVKHRVIFRLASEQAVQDVRLRLSFMDDEEDLKMPPTKVQGTQHVSELEKDLDVTIGEFTATASSALVLFKQSEYRGIVNPDNCPAALIEIKALTGKFVEGIVSPPIAGLDIQLSVGDKPMLVAATDQKGKYRFGPLPADGQYSVTVEKPGYILAKDETNPFNFKAFKLAEVAVRVQSEAGDSLTGVILSLSGNTYKSNNRTDDSGRFSFIGLSPGMYYLRAILKEYEFTPMSLEVEVKEGVTEQVKVRGKRIAYSCTGSVVSLRSQPVSRTVVVKAQGVDGEDCVNTEESSQAEPNGQFYVRGLKPGCSYRLAVIVLAGQDDSSIFRVSPNGVTIAMKANDVDVGRFIVAESSASTDVAVFIDTPTEYLPTLKVILTKDGSSSPLQSISIENSKVVFFSSLPMDSSKYRVVMDSSLSKKLYEYEVIEELFVADGPSEPLTFRFAPKVRTKVEYEVKESSVLALLVVALTTVLVFNKDKVLNIIRKQS